jgi:hypothetical protein
MQKRVAMIEVNVKLDIVPRDVDGVVLIMVLSVSAVIASRLFAVVRRVVSSLVASSRNKK